MIEQIKCSQCGGTKCQQVSGNTYRCLYCGTTFTLELAKEENPTTTPPATPQQPQVVVVQTQQPQPQKIVVENNGKSGCLVALGVILGFIALFFDSFHCTEPTILCGIGALACIVSGLGGKIRS